MKRNLTSDELYKNWKIYNDESAFKELNINA